MDTNESKDFFERESKRRLRQAHSDALSVWLLTAKEFVASHYSAIDIQQRAQLEVTVAIGLQAARSNEQIFLLLNDLLLRLSEKEAS